MVTAFIAIERSLNKHRNGNTGMTNENDDIQAVEKLGEARDAIVTELRKTIVGLEFPVQHLGQGSASLARSGNFRFALRC